MVGFCLIKTDHLWGNGRFLPTLHFFEIFFEDHQSFSGEPQIFIGPQIFVGDPKIFIGDPTIVIGYPQENLGVFQKNSWGSPMKIFGAFPNPKWKYGKYNLHYFVKKCELCRKIPTAELHCKGVCIILYIKVLT